MDDHERLKSHTSSFLNLEIPLYIKKLYSWTPYTLKVHSTVLYQLCNTGYYYQEWARLLSRYGDWVWTGQSGIESRWGRDYLPVQTGPGAHPASCKMGTRSFTGVKCGWGVLLTTHPLLVPWLWKSRAILLPTLWVTPGLWRDHFTLYILNI